MRLQIADALFQFIFKIIKNILCKNLHISKTRCIFASQLNAIKHNFYEAAKINTRKIN